MTVMAADSDVLDRKLDRVFTMLDFDSDGRLAQEDLDTVAEQLGLAFGLSGTDPKVVALRAAFAAQWPDISTKDADGDGRITVEEYRESLKSSVAQDRAGFLDRFYAMVAAWLAIADTDNDGLISLAEYTAMFAATVSAGEDALRTAFAQLDLNGDGQLSSEEIRIAVEEYYTSEDPQARGNWLLGPF